MLWGHPAGCHNNVCCAGYALLWAFDKYSLNKELTDRCVKPLLIFFSRIHANYLFTALFSSSVKSINIYRIAWL
jgi:hypothetical protein